MLLIFKRETGVTVDNLPGEFFAIARSATMSPEGDLKIATDEDAIAIAARLRRYGFNNVNGNGDLVWVSANHMTDLDRLANELRNNGDNNTVGVIDIANTAFEPNAPVGVHTADEIDNALDRVVIEGMRAAAGVTVEETAEHNLRAFDEIDTTPRDEDDYDFVVPTFEMRDVTREELLRILPSLTTPEGASQVKLCTDKIREFERIWSQAITIKRQIESLMSEIDQNEVMKKINDDVEYLTQKCACVESVKVGATGSGLLITTKEVTTSAQPRYGARLLGRMMIEIDLRYVYANVPPTTNYAKAIKIYNLDRNPLDDDSYWQCGHVRSDDNGDQSICWGGYYQQLFDAFVAKDVARLFDTTLRFISNPYEDDAWGRNVRLFPEAVTSET